MTYAPPDLLAIQRYAREKARRRDDSYQPWSSFGIIHSVPDGGGYHEGNDLLAAAGSAPGPQYPDTDYSYGDAPQWDLNPDGTLAGGDAASAFDHGGDFPRFIEFNLWMAAKIRAGDPRTKSIRSFIYFDGTRVRRVDNAGVRSDSGDDSHRSHSHTSFKRRSIGQRDRMDDYMGLLVEFFDGAAPTQEVPDVDAEQNRRLVSLEEREHQKNAYDRDELTYPLPADQRGGPNDRGNGYGRTPNREKLRHVEVTGKLDAVLRALGVAQADIDELQARPAAPSPTDEQIQHQAELIAQTLREDSANPISEEHLAATTEAVKRALREGVAVAGALAQAAG